jgi:hypothetical protein
LLVGPVAASEHAGTSKLVEQARFECEQTGEVELSIALRLELLLEFQGVPGRQQSQYGIGRKARDRCAVKKAAVQTTTRRTILSRR